MSSNSLSVIILFIVNALNGSPGNKKNILLKLLEAYRGRITDTEIYDLIDYYRRNPTVIEAVFASGALTEKSAERMLKLFPKNKRYHDLVHMAYEHNENELDHVHETMFDGRKHQANA